MEITSSRNYYKTLELFNNYFYQAVWKRIQYLAWLILYQEALFARLVISSFPEIPKEVISIYNTSKFLKYIR
jgi:hypothetical protein